MADIRTVIVTMTPMLSDIITTLIADHVTLDVVAQFDSRAHIEKQLPVIAPGLILVGLSGAETDEIGHILLTLVPIARVIAFSRDGRDAYVHEMRAHRTALMDVSPRSLIDAILGTRTNSKT